MEAIVYTSKTGFTKKYAGILGEKTGLPVYDLHSAGGVKKGGEIIYLGWLSAGRVKGYRKAASLFNIRALCAVGMATPGGQPVANIKKANGMPESLNVFYLQGGLDMNKLKGINKLALSIVVNTFGRSLEKKQDLTPEEADQLDLIRNNGSRVRPENLEPLLEWYAGL